MVETRTPSFCSTEARRVSPIAVVAAGISTGVGKSTRVKHDAGVGDRPGRSVNSTLRPECTPMPTVFTIDFDSALLPT